MALPTRADVINFYAKKIGAKSYLEIGVQTGATFHAVQIDHKVGVDPDPHSEATIHTTSDLFFSLNGEKFDIIFVSHTSYLGCQYIFPSHFHNLSIY